MRDARLGALLRRQYVSRVDDLSRLRHPASTRRVLRPQFHCPVYLKFRRSPRCPNAFKSTHALIVSAPSLAFSLLNSVLPTTCAQPQLWKAMNMLSTTSRMTKICLIVDYAQKKFPASPYYPIALFGPILVGISTVALSSLTSRCRGGKSTAHVRSVHRASQAVRRGSSPTAVVEGSSLRLTLYTKRKRFSDLSV